MQVSKFTYAITEELYKGTKNSDFIIKIEGEDLILATLIRTNKDFVQTVINFLAI